METLTQIQTSEYFRDNLVISKFSNIYQVIKAVKEKPDATYNEFKKIINVSGGALYSHLKDAKIMQLYTNGGNKTLTQLGEKWLNGGKHPPKEIIREACLNVPLFRILYREKPDIIIQSKIYEFFKNYISDQSVDEGLIRRAVKRYLEGVHSIQTERSPRLKLFKTQANLGHDFAEIFTKTVSEVQNNQKYTIKEYLELHSQLKNLKEKLGAENIKILLEL